MHLAGTQAHEKVDEYAAVLEEVKTRQPTLLPTHLQRLMLDLVGDPHRAKMAKEATLYPKRGVQDVSIGSPSQATAVPLYSLLGSVLHLCGVGAHCM